MDTREWLIDRLRPCCPGQRVGAGTAGPKAKSQLDLANPNLDFVHIGNGMGAPSMRVGSCDELMAAVEQAASTPGPHLIEVIVPSPFRGRKLKMLPRALRTIGVLPRPIANAGKRRLAPRPTIR